MDKDPQYISSIWKRVNNILVQYGKGSTIYEGLFIQYMTCTACMCGWTNALKYVLVAFMPLTLFYVVIPIFSINMASSKLQGFVLISQIVTLPMLMRVFVLNFSFKINTITMLKILGHCLAFGI